MRYLGLRKNTYLVPTTVLLLAVSSLIGCARWHTPAATPIEVLRREPERVQVHTTTGQELILDAPRIVGDSVEGRRLHEDADSMGTVRVALEEVSSVSVWVGPPDTGVSLAYMGVGVAVVMTAFIVFVTAAAGGS